MHSVRRRRSFVLVTLALALALAAAGLGALLSASATGAPRARSAAGGLSPKPTPRERPGLSTAAVQNDARKTSSSVIVVLRDQLTPTPASKRHAKARIAAEAAADAPIESQVQQSGGHIYKRYHALNAFAATVSGAERTKLSHDGGVQSVIADTPVVLPRPDRRPTDTASGGSGQVSPGAGNGQLCPSDPSKPLLQPEALQTTHAAFNDPSVPQAQSLATGKNVKVAFFADGLDINNPDFIRPDGSHVTQI